MQLAVGQLPVLLLLLVLQLSHGYMSRFLTRSRCTRSPSLESLVNLFVWRAGLAGLGRRLFFPVLPLERGVSGTGLRSRIAMTLYIYTHLVALFLEDRQ